MNKQYWNQKFHAFDLINWIIIYKLGEFHNCILYSLLVACIVRKNEYNFNKWKFFCHYIRWVLSEILNVSKKNRSNSTFPLYTRFQFEQTKNIINHQFNLNYFFFTLRQILSALIYSLRISSQKKEDIL